MRKSDFVRAIADRTELTHVKAEGVVEVILETIQDALSRGESVRYGSGLASSLKAR